MTSTRLALPALSFGIFSSNKIVRNRVLNLLGCQAIRAALARTLLTFRRRRWLADSNEMERTLLRDGIVLIEDFCDDNTFTSLSDEMRKGDLEFVKTRPLPDKFGVIRQQIGVHKHPDRFPIANRVLLQDRRLLQAIRLQEGWKPADVFSTAGAVLKYERLEQQEDPVLPDASHDREISSGDLHADTFHFVSKAFLTLSDMTLQNGPYVYCYGSQKLSLQRLLWEYLNSVEARQYWGDGYYNRVFPDQMTALNVRPTPIVTKKNTLVITDTFGFHCRGQMQRVGEVRRMLRMDFRTDPFRL